MFEGGGDVLGRLDRGDWVADVADDEDRWRCRGGHRLEGGRGWYRPLGAGQRERPDVGRVEPREHGRGVGRLGGERFDVGFGGGVR